MNQDDDLNAARGIVFGCLTTLFMMGIARI